MKSPTLLHGARRHWLRQVSSFALVPLTAALAVLGGPARAQPVDAVQRLRDFGRKVQSGRAAFTQTVIAPDGTRRRATHGTFEFARPDRFRFAYAKPFEQLIVADGQKVWIFDPDLNQASSRRMDQAVGATPAAILAGGAIDAEFELALQPSEEGFDWVQATPRARGGSIERLRVGFKGDTLAAMDIVDSFGQRSQMRFTAFETNPTLPADRFRFRPPAGADVIEQ